MRVLVTGASGFIGHACCAELLARGHEVQALVRRPGSEPPGHHRRGRRHRRRQAAARRSPQAQPDGVVHLAAEIATQRDEAKLQAANVDGTARHWRAVACWPPRAASRPRFVFASTVVTGEAAGALLDEQTPLPVTTPYGRSKQAGERLVLESGLPAVVVRPSHVYGPGGWFAHEIVARLRQPGRFAVVGRGDNLWDVVHVDDVASALVDAPSAPSRESSTTSSTTSRSAATTSSPSPPRRSASAGPGACRRRWPGSWPAEPR